MPNDTLTIIPTATSVQNWLPLLCLECYESNIKNINRDVVYTRNLLKNSFKINIQCSQHNITPEHITRIIYSQDEDFDSHCVVERYSFPVDDVDDMYSVIVKIYRKQCLLTIDEED